MGVSLNVDIKKAKYAKDGYIFSEESCSASQTNHALLLIGFDEKKNEWILKNSWGNSKHPYVRVNIIKEFPIYKNHRCFCGGMSKLCSAFYISYDDT